MNYSYTDHTGNGSTITFPFSFVGPAPGYLSQSHIKVYVNDVQRTYSLSGTNQVTITPAPPIGSIVRIRRVVPKELPFSDFSRGNNFTGTLLNKSFLQQLYAYHEFLDGFSDSGVYQFKGGLTATYLSVFFGINMNGSKISQLAEPQQANDAATKFYVDSKLTEIVGLTEQASQSAERAEDAATRAEAIGGVGPLPSSQVQMQPGVTLADISLQGSEVVIAGIKAGDISKRISNSITPEEFGAVGDGAVDDSIPIFNWLTTIASDASLYGVANNQYLVNSISISAVNGLTIVGSGRFKATGSPRLGMILIANVQGTVAIDGVVFDGNSIVARPLEIKNIGNVGAGNVYIGQYSKFVNAKNIAPLVNDSSAIRIQGAFSNVIFEGEVDNVDNTLTSGGVSVGAWFDWSGPYFIRNVLITSKARVKNVRNDNSITADCDGIQRMGPTAEDLTFTVQAGSYFENCKGRSLKSQVTGNFIESPIIVRDLYDGLVEVDLQYAGGYCNGARVYYDGVRVNTVFGSTSRLGLPSDCTFSNNVVTIKNQPLNRIQSLINFSATDNTDTVEQRGILATGNKVKGGAVQHVVSVRASNKLAKNRVVVRDNYADLVDVSYLNVFELFNNPCQLNLVFEGNSAGSQCSGLQVAGGGQIVVESDRANHNISAVTQRSEAILSGTLTLQGGNTQLILTESSSATDDLDTIVGVNYATGDILTIILGDPSQVITVRSGVGNVYLSTSEFTLNSVRDRLLLSYDKVLNQFYEIARSNNG